MTGRASAWRHAIEVLEFERVLDLVAGFAAGDAGAGKVRALMPLTAPAEIAAEQERVEAVRRLVARDEGWPPQPVPDLAAALERLQVPGTSWTARELRAAHALLVSSRLTQRALSEATPEAADVRPLATVAEALVRDPETEKAIDHLVTEEGDLRDDASPVLRRTRKELRGAEGDLVRMLERLMGRLDAQYRVEDGSVTLRNGRYVIPVRREGRGAVGGIVHDASGSGGTLFVEPPAAIEAGNRIRELEAEEQRETERILLDATEGLRPRGPALARALDALATLDGLYARARYAIANTCVRATLAGPATGFAIVQGRHPLLLAQDREAVVPFDLTMGPSEHTLLVSGPNTGGKTVLLKAVALVSLMEQAGIPAPVGAGSRLAVFDRVFADIGDEQSIAASLSTFSAHVKNLSEIVREATDRSLVLVDELGSGTDPVEGAALGGAILESLTRRGTTTVASTHLGTLKELAHEVSGVVNASLQFDVERLAPTFRLVKGLPGRSYGLSIARRLAMPEDVLANAEARVPGGERELTALLEDLERRVERLAVRERAVEEREESVTERNGRVTERERQVRDRERELERGGRESARRYLLEARQEIEKTIRELRVAGAEGIDATAAAARRAAELRAADEAQALARLDADARRAVAESAGGAENGTIETGSTVVVATIGGKTGRVLELRGQEAVVVVGELKLAVPVASLRRAHGAPARAVVPLAGDQPELEVRREVDVRGMRLGEMDDVVVQALDAAVRADLHALRIIHGKGTGALRERVAELLREDRRVRAFRPGAWNEGGAGVTVADLT